MKNKYLLVILTILILVVYVFSGCIQGKTEGNTTKKNPTQSQNNEEETVIIEADPNVVEKDNKMNNDDFNDQPNSHDPGNYSHDVIGEDDGEPVVVVDVVTEDGVSYTDSGDFYYVEATSVTLSGDITIKGKIKNKPVKIKSFGFENCLINNVHIEAGVIQIEPLAFAGCNRLVAFTIDPNNKYYAVEDGVLYSKDFKKLIQYPAGRKTSALTLRDSVMDVQGGALDIPELEIISLSYTSAANDVMFTEGGILFSATSIDAPTRRLIKYPARKQDTAYTIPSSVVEIADGAFKDSKNLITINMSSANVTTIGQGAFQNCVALKNFTASNATVAYPKNTFSNCIALNKFTFPAGLTSIGEAAFELCNAVGFNQIVIPNGVTSIGKDAFYGCNNMTSLTLPKVGGGNDHNDYLGYIFGSDSRDYNGSKVPSKLTNVSVTNATEIGLKAFKGCTSILTISINEGVTTIEADAFNGCAKITNFVIPNSVTTIQAQAFEDCRSLQTITFGSGIQMVEKDAFRYCESLARFNITNNLNYFKITFENFYSNPASVNSICQPYYNNQLYTDVEIPAGNGITVIEKYLFYNWNCLNSISIPYGITSIEDSAFEACNNLTSIELPSTITTIYRSAFSRSGLTQITIPSGVTNIPDDCFMHCQSLRKVIFSSNPQVATISKKAFYNCKNLNEIVIPSSVTTIGEKAFNSCNRLASINIPANCTTIQEGAFNQCGGLKKIIIDSQTILNTIDRSSKSGSICGNPVTNRVLVKSSLTIPENSYIRTRYPIVLTAEDEGGTAGYNTYLAG